MNELLKRLKVLSTSSLSDANKSIRVLDGGIRKFGNSEGMVGLARVVSCGDDFLNVLSSLNEATAGEVLVVEARSSTRAVLGGLFCSEAKRRGLSGVIVDGPIRDMACIEGLNFPVYARNTCPCAGASSKLSNTFEPVVVGGVMVSSGDIVVGDKDGVVVGNVNFFQSVVDLAEEIERAEAFILKKLQNNVPLSKLLNLETHLKKIESGEESVLQFKVDE